MREIRFRAWGTHTKKMHSWVELLKLNLPNIMRGSRYSGMVLMQYTGLKDKNGKEIYEGDIVENTTQTVYLGDKYEVVWNKNYAGYQLMSNGFTSNIPLIQDFMSYEVIGNIYEQED